MQNARPKILVLCGGSIGDFIFTLPALAALRRRWPSARIELIGYPHIAQLAVAGQLVDRVISIDKSDVARLFSMSATIPHEQAAFFRSFDLIITYLFDPYGTVKENMLNAGARQVIYGSPKVTSRHAVDHFMMPLEELAIYSEKDEHPVLKLAKTDKIERKPLVAIHPGSGSPRKNWPLQNYVTLADMITSRLNMKPVFTSGEADSEIKESLCRMKSGVELVENRPLVDLAHFLASCSGFAGNDTGITHLSAALGIPVVALFGPTDPRTWGPRGPNVRIIQSAEPTTESLAEITVDKVFKALEEQVG